MGANSEEELGTSVIQPQFDNTNVSAESNQFENSTFFFDFPEKSKTSLAVKDIKRCLAFIHSSITCMEICNKVKNQIYDQLIELTQKSAQFYCDVIEDHQSTSISHVLNQSCDFIQTELKSHCSTYKRDLKEMSCMLNQKNWRSVCDGSVEKKQDPEKLFLCHD